MSLDELTVVGHWRREQILGSGAFATITLWVNNENNERVALKQRRKDFPNYSPKAISYYDDQWQQEIAIMKQLNCKNVVKALKLPQEFMPFSTRTPILAMEYCSGGDLRKLLTKPSNCCGLSEKEVRQILKQISSALMCLHDSKIIHRDLKPENIVLQLLPCGKTLYKLTDLGYAKKLSNCSSAQSFVGTLEYLAPELFQGIKYTSAVDNWSFGVIAFEIITGRRPFLPNHTNAEILEALKFKKSSDICTEIDATGVHFSSEIPDVTRICRTFKNDLENWFKVVLDYNPEKRGGRNAFEMITQILKKYQIQIFSLDSYETCSFDIDTDTNLDDLKENIYNLINTIPKHQQLFFLNGDSPAYRIGEQIIRTWYTPDSWFERYNPVVIFMFDNSKGYLDHEFYKCLILPSEVENMLLNQPVTDFSEIKFTWRSSVCVAQQTITKYTLIHDAMKGCILYCITLFNKLQNDNRKLFDTITEVYSSAELVLKLFKSHHNSNGIENGFKTSFPGIYSKLKKLSDFGREKIREHFINSEKIIPKFDKEFFIFEDIFLSPEIDSSLKNKFIEIQNAYDSLRKRKKEEFMKQFSNNLMFNLLCDCFKLVEDLLRNKFKVFPMLSKFIKDIDMLRFKCRQLQREIDDRKSKDLEELLRKVSKTSSSSSSSSNNLTELNEMNFELIDFEFTPNMHEKLIIELEKEYLIFKKESYNFKHLEIRNFLF